MMMTSMDHLTERCRMDKYLALIRKVIRSALTLVKEHQDDSNILKEYNSCLPLTKEVKHHSPIHSQPPITPSTQMPIKPETMYSLIQLFSAVDRRLSL